MFQFFNELSYRQVQFLQKIFFNFTARFYWLARCSLRSCNNFTRFAILFSVFGFILWL